MTPYLMYLIKLSSGNNIIKEHEFKNNTKMGAKSEKIMDENMKT